VTEDAAFHRYAETVERARAERDAAIREAEERHEQERLAIEERFTEAVAAAERVRRGAA
jgi:hypothetical protein